MKKTAYLLVALLALSAVPVLAQGPFTDVPADHWAYDAINTLQKDGIMIGYPDGTYQGKRTITRYEFAVAISRAMAAMPTPPGGGLSKADVEGMLEPYAKKSDIPTVPTLANLATKADVDALRKLIDEFRDEIAALGVDVDALKRDVAALGARVDAIEAELKRVHITGDATVFAIASASNGLQANLVDLDQRVTTKPNDSILRNISMVKDFDLMIAGRVSNCITANATINYGDYLNYLGFVDDYVGGSRPTSTKVSPGTKPGTSSTLADNFFPYYLSIDAALGKGSVSVGRFPLQFTPYTLKKIDVDSYTSILKTDDGNYPVDGAKVAYNFGGVDLTLYAAKHDTNAYLLNGLTGQPTVSPALNFHQIATGHAVGGLAFASQSAGIRATAGIPYSGILGVTFYQAWDRSGYSVGYDGARVYGADLAIPIPVVQTLALAGSYTRSDTLVTNSASFAAPRGTVANVDYQNAAWDAKLTGNVSALNIGAGYKQIGRNFAAAGAWDKIGRWTNPTNVQGPYAELAYPIMDNLKLSLNGEYLKVVDNNGGGTWGTSDNDKLIKAEGALRWGFTKMCAVDLAYQWVKFTPNTGPSFTTATENYITLGLSHQMSPNAGIKLGYQYIAYTNGNVGTLAGGPYGADYKGSLGVVQFGVSF